MRPTKDSPRSRLRIQEGEIIAHLRIGVVANHAPTLASRAWLANCLHCGEVVRISYSGIKTRLKNDTVHCRKCNPNGPGPLHKHAVGLEIARVRILSERTLLIKKPDNGRRSWDCECLDCGARFARNSNRLRKHEAGGTSACPRCNPLKEPSERKHEYPTSRQAAQYSRRTDPPAPRNYWTDIEYLAYCGKW